MTRRPVLGGIAFGLVALAILVAVGAALYGWVSTRDAFDPAPPWWTVTATIAAGPVGILALLALVLGIVGTARRETPGWPAVAAMILAVPGLGYVALVVYVWLAVSVACAGPQGACAS